MATGLAELTSRREALGDEAQRLREEGDRRRLKNQPTGEISRRLEEIESEMPGLNASFKEARREHGVGRAREMGTEKAFQATLRQALDVLMPLVALDTAIRQQRGQGTALEALPRPLLELITATRRYTDYLHRVGVLEEK